MEGKTKPSKGRRGKGKGYASNDTAALPECFHSGHSDNEEFWGFPVDFANTTIATHYSIQYNLDHKENSDKESQEEFKGFARSEMYVAIYASL